MAKLKLTIKSAAAIEQMLKIEAERLAKKHQARKENNGVQGTLEKPTG